MSQNKKEPITIRADFNGQMFEIQPLQNVVQIAEWGEKAIAAGKRMTAREKGLTPKRLNKMLTRRTMLRLINEGVVKMPRPLRKNLQKAATDEQIGQLFELIAKSLFIVAKTKATPCP